MQRRLAPLLGSNYSYPVWNRLMEILGIAAYASFAAMFTGVLARIAWQLGAARALDGLWLVPVAFLAFLIGDFTSGFVHCAADNFGSPETPVFGVAFIRPFRDHHADPLGITRHDFVETNGNSCIVNLTVLIPAYYALAHAEASVSGFLAGTFILLFTLAIVLTNQVHKWAHMAAPPQWAVWLQRFGLILHPENHAVHHTAPFDKNYCITTGWMNGVVERFGFFAWLVRTFK